MLRIPDVYPGSEFISIPDPIFFHPGSQIRFKEFKYFNPKNCFLSSCSSRILIIYSSRIPNPGVKKAPDQGSGSATLLVQHLRILSRLSFPGCAKSGSYTDPGQGFYSMTKLYKFSVAKMLITNRHIFFLNP